MSDLYWGIDIGGTNVKLGLVTAEGKVVADANFLTRADLGPDQCLEHILAACEDVAGKYSVTLGDVKAYGICSPGPLSQKEGKLFKLVNLPKFSGLEIVTRLSAMLGCAGVLENDVNAHCWGEYLFGAGRGVKDLVHLALGTGVGGGIICDGRLVRGSEGNAAELGHMIIYGDGRMCACGQQGCLEAYASATAVVEMVWEKLDASRGKSSLADVENMSCKDVFDHGQAGDKLALEVVEEVAKAIAIAAVTMRHITEPQRMTLGGGVFKAGDFLLDRIQSHYEKQCWTLKPEPMEFRIGELDDHAGVLGAAGLAIDRQL